MSVLRNAFLKINEGNLAKGVHKFIEKANVDNEDEFVLKAETSFPFLQKHIQSFKNDGVINSDVGSEEVKLKKAFEFVTDKLHEEVPELCTIDPYASQQSLFTNHSDALVQKLKEIRDKILALKLVFIQLENEDDAYLIFETLNARGRDLTTPDLVKNLLLKKLQSSNVSFDQAKESWNSLIKQFDAVSDKDIVDKFLLQFWVSRYEYTPDKRLFSKVKQMVDKSPTNAQLLFEELHEAAPLYCRMIQPDSFIRGKEEVEIKEYLKALNTFKVKQQSSFVLSLLRAHKRKLITSKNLREALAKVVDFHYSFNAITNQRSSGSIHTGYSRLAIKLSAITEKNEFQVIYNELCEFYRSKLPEFNEFLVKFGELSYLKNKTKYKQIIRYTLNRLFPKNNNGITFDVENMTLEHLVPQSDKSMDDRFISSIGNLILTDKKINSELLADNPATDKISYLQSIGYPLKEVFIEGQAWNEELINKRTNKLAVAIFECIKI